MEANMKVEGRCHCGQITYDAEVDPAGVSICHCTDCQMLTGSGYRVSVRAPRETFHLRTGQPRTYIKTADSGERRAHSFCPDCGTPIYACAVEDPPTYSLRVGCLQQRAQLPPRRQIWCRSALAWTASLDHLPKLDRQ
jgi:hypothetical protein